MIIAETDLGESAESALRASECMKGLSGLPARVAVHLQDPATAEPLHPRDAGVDLFAVSETQTVARSIMLRHPPFLLAHRMGASAVHVLIIGFDALGQELARDVILYAACMNLDHPHITVIDEHADLVRRDVLNRHPELPHVCVFEAFPHLDAARFGGPEPSRGQPPICASYVCLRDSTKAVAAAIDLREAATREDMIQGPIFTWLRWGGLTRPPGASAGRWERLPEEMRASNRRVMSHIPAKLATLGFDLEPRLATPDEERPRPPPIAPGAPLFRDSAERTRLARLEHERWMTDRRLSGWRQGRRRDNARRIHTDFAPFDDWRRPSNPSATTSSTGWTPICRGGRAASIGQRRRHGVQGSGKGRSPAGVSCGASWWS